MNGIAWRQCGLVIVLLHVAGIVLPGAADAAVPSLPVLFPPAVYAADSRAERSPYGGSRTSTYGEKRAVTSAREAEQIIREYFSKRKVKIGEVREREVYYEAEIRDGSNELIDKVIVDKRTGRIRSIY